VRYWPGEQTSVNCLEIFSEWGYISETKRRESYSEACAKTVYFGSRMKNDEEKSYQKVIRTTERTTELKFFSPSSEETALSFRNYYPTLKQKQTRCGVKVLWNSLVHELMPFHPKISIQAAAIYTTDWMRLRSSKLPVLVTQSSIIKHNTSS